MMSPSEPGDTPAVIYGRQLSFRWPGASQPTLELPALDVGPAERLFIAGASGSGKTTLLGLLAGVNLVSGGELRVLGVTLNRLSGAARDRFRADHLGYIFQLFNLLPYLSVLENVTLPCRFSRRRRQQAGGQPAAIRAEARRLLAHLDLDEPELLRRPVTELSVGQQQRVAAARAMIGGPELVIADEPTSALDQDRRESFLRLLFAECDRQRAALVFVSHDRSLAHLFHRHLELR